MQLKNVLLFLLFVASIGITGTLAWSAKARNNSTRTDPPTEKEPVFNVCIVELEKWGELNPVTREITGIYNELFLEITKRMDCRFRFSLAPYPRVIQSLRNGNCDLSITIPPADAKGILISERFHTIRIGIYSSKSKPITAYEELIGKRVGAITGAPVAPRFDKDDRFHRLEMPQHLSLLRMLQTGRIDAVVGDISTIEMVIEDSNIDFSKIGEPVEISTTPLHLLISRESAAVQLEPEIQQILRSLKEEGIVKNILKKHRFGYREETTPIQRSDQFSAEVPEEMALLQVRESASP